MTMANAGQPASSSPLVLETRDAGVLTLTLNRPDRLNALNPELGVALSQALDRAAQDPDVRVVVLTTAVRASTAAAPLPPARDVRDPAAFPALPPPLRPRHNTSLPSPPLPQPALSSFPT